MNCLTCSDASPETRVLYLSARAKNMVLKQEQASVQHLQPFRPKCQQC